MKNYILVAVAALLIGAGAGYFGLRYTQCPHISGMARTPKCDIYQAMDKLWAEHVLWTRQFIVSSVAGLGDAQVAAERLLRNQDDIGAAIVPFYGKEAGDQLATLLREHINVAAEIVGAAIKKDNAKVKELDTKWHENAAAIAAFLGKANPNWNEKSWKDMLYEHLAITTKELQLRLKNEWKEDVKNYDKVFDQGLMMGKDIAAGIIQQFPDKF